MATQTVPLGTEIKIVPHETGIDVIGLPEPEDPGVPEPEATLSVCRFSQDGLNKIEFVGLKGPEGLWSITTVGGPAPAELNWGEIQGLADKGTLRTYRPTTAYVEKGGKESDRSNGDSPTESEQPEALAEQERQDRLRRERERAEMPDPL